MHLRDFDKLLITDQMTDLENNSSINVLRVDFELENNARKAELIKFLPPEWSEFIFFDTDIEVFDDLSLGIEKALFHGFALAPANSYLLEQYSSFDKIMILEGIEPKGQLQYNSGLFFFSTAYPGVKEVLKLWLDLCRKYSGRSGAWKGDQPYLNLAFEISKFAPYCLSPNYNYRPSRSRIQGKIRVWHSWRPAPANINEQYRKWRTFDFRSGAFKLVDSPNSIRKGFRRFSRRIKKLVPRIRHSL